MKKVWILFAVLMVGSTAFVFYPRGEEPREELVAQEPEDEEEKVEWMHWNEGFLKAKKEGKMAIIDCYTDWCGWCKVMDKKTFSDPDVIESINKHFVPIKFNPELKEEYTIGDNTYTGRELLGQLSQNKFGGYPTIFVYIPQNAKMFQHPGYQEANAFNDMLKKYIAYQKGL